MPITQQDYFLKPGESIESYNQRIAGLRNTVAPTAVAEQQPNLTSRVNQALGGQFFDPTTDKQLQQFTPAVVSSTQARQLTEDNKQLVNQLPVVQGQQQQPSSSVITATSTDPNMQSAITQINQFLSKPEVSKFITPEIRNQVANINTTNIENQALTASARSALQSGDARAFNERTESLKQSQEKQNQLLQSFVEQSRPLQERALALALPSAAETDIRKQLADLRTSTELGAEQQLGVGRPLAISVGRSEKVLRQGLAIERNVLEKLGLAQEARQAEREAVRLGQQSIFQNFELAQKALDRQSKEEDRFLDIALKFNDRQRQTLADILDTFKGSDPDQLPIEVQAQIGSLAASQGIPPSIVTEGLKTARNKEVIEQQTRQLQQQKLIRDMVVTSGGIELPISPDTGKIIPKSPIESQKVNKELVSNDAYKVVRKGQDALQFLLDFENIFKKSGLETLPGKAKADLRTTYQTTILNLKEFFNLGVLNGPDITVLQGIIPDPTTGVFKFARGRTSAVTAGIENMKRNIERTLDDRFQSLSTQYGNYDEDSVTSLKDLKRIYIQQKSKLNPKTASLVRENPQMSADDIIQIINQAQ